MWRAPTMRKISNSNISTLFIGIKIQVKRPKPSNYPSYPISIGEHLLKKRLDNNKTQKEIASILKISINTLSNWENNKTRPNISQFAKIIEFLGYDPFKPNENTFASRILAYRRRKGLSQKKMAKILSLDEETIIRLEKGAKAQLRTLEIVEKFLKG